MSNFRSSYACSHWHMFVTCRAVALHPQDALVIAVPLQCSCWSECLWRLKAHNGSGGLCLGPSLCCFAWKPVQWKALGQLAFKNSFIVSVVFFLPNNCVCKWCPMTSQNPVQLHSEWSHLNASCSNVVLPICSAQQWPCSVISVVFS